MIFRILIACTASLLSNPLIAATMQVSPPPSSTISQPSQIIDGDYRLGVADKVRVIVFGEPTLSGEFFVNANGALSMPLIGDVHAAGVTTTEVANAIKVKLQDGYVLEPRVSIDVLTFRPYYILGEVNKPGEYPYSSGLTIDNAVATAGGLTYRANKNHVFIRHAGEQAALRIKPSPDTAVRPGDTIRIGERHF